MLESRASLSQWGLIAGPVQAIVQTRLTHDKIGCLGSLSLGLYASELGIPTCGGIGCFWNQFA